MIRSFTSVLLLSSALTLLSACAQMRNVSWPWESVSPASTGRGDTERARSASRPAVPPTPPSPAANEPPSSADLYAEGMRLYRAGQYDGALAHFAQVHSPTSLRVQALKYSAFSYCVTNRLALCEQTFQQLLAISPQFRLNAAEQGHPVWDPVFRKARQAQRRSRSGRR